MKGRRAVPAAIALSVLMAAAACTQGRDSDATSSLDQEPNMTNISPLDRDADSGSDNDPAGRVQSRSIAVRGTRLHVTLRGAGAPLLLIHGGGEDATMLADQAAELARHGYRVISYDRRGTGRSGRADWPGSGADQHADDAAALLAALDLGPATVLGMSSGGVIAMALAARHSEAVDRVIAWEPPALGLLPGAAEINAEVMAPIERHLGRHPGDFVGAQALLLSMVVGFEVSVDDPAFAAARANAEPFIRDEPSITMRSFDASELADAPLTVAVGASPNDIVAGAAARIEQLTGSDVVDVPGADHEVYLHDPEVLADLVGAAGQR